MKNVGDQRFALEQAERNRLGFRVEQSDDEAPDLRFGLGPADAIQAIQIQAVEKRAVDLFLEILVVALPYVHYPRASGGWCHRGFHRG